MKTRERVNMALTACVNTLTSSIMDMGLEISPVETHPGCCHLSVILWIQDIFPSYLCMNALHFSSRHLARQPTNWFQWIKMAIDSRHILLNRQKKHGTCTGNEQVDTKFATGTIYQASVTMKTVNSTTVNCHRRFLKSWGLFWSKSPALGDLHADWPSAILVISVEKTDVAAGQAVASSQINTYPTSTLM